MLAELVLSPWSKRHHGALLIASRMSVPVESASTRSRCFVTAAVAEPQCSAMYDVEAE